MAFVAPLNSSQKMPIVYASSFTSDNVSWNAYTNTDSVSGLNFYMFVSSFAMGNANTMTWNRDLISQQFRLLQMSTLRLGLMLLMQLCWGCSDECLKVRFPNL